MLLLVSALAPSQLVVITIPTGLVLDRCGWTKVPLSAGYSRIVAVAIRDGCNPTFLLLTRMVLGHLRLKSRRSLLLKSRHFF